MSVSGCLKGELTKEQAKNIIRYLPTMIIAWAIIDIFDLFSFGYLSKYIESKIIEANNE